MPQPAENIIQFPTQKKKKGTHPSGLIARHFRYTDPITGAAKRKSVYGKTAAEAEKKKRAFLAKVEQGLRVAEQGKTVGMWADEWLKHYKKPHVGPKRLQALQYEINRLNDSLGYKKLSQVVQSDIQQIVNSRIGLSGDAIRETASTIRAIFQSAVDNRIIPFNPALGITIPHGKDGSHRCLTAEEEAVILQVIKTPHRFSLAVALMLFAGLRRGEVAAFNVDRDVDIDAETITISRAVSYGDNKGIEGDPKSEAGFRTIPIMPPLLPMLKSAKGYAIKRKGDVISFTSLRGAYRSFLYACEEVLNGCSKRWMPEGHAWKSFKFQMHDLRHTFSTMLYDAGVDIKTHQTWMGHATPSEARLTLGTYTHLSSQRLAASTKLAKDYFAERFGGKNGGISNHDT
jgi:integrase